MLLFLCITYLFFPSGNTYGVLFITAFEEFDYDVPLMLFSSCFLCVKFFELHRCKVYSFHQLWKISGHYFSFYGGGVFHEIGIYFLFNFSKLLYRMIIYIKNSIYKYADSEFSEKEAHLCN